MVKPKVFWMMMIMAALACLMVDTITSSQNVMAYDLGPAVDEAGEASPASYFLAQYDPGICANLYIASTNRHKYSDDVSRYRMDIKYSLNPVVFGIVIALTSVLFVTPWFQSDMTISYGTGGSGGGGGSGGLLVCPPVCPDADIDIAEAVEAENATMAGGATNQITSNENMTAPEFQSIQNAQSGSISQVNATAYTLQLNNVSDEMIMFSDRPDRIVLSVSTDDFIGNWTSGLNSFATDPPNAVLILEDDLAQRQDLDIIELSNPEYDIATNTLTYSIISENETSIDPTGDFGRPIILIDRTCGPPPPLSADVVCL